MKKDSENSKSFTIYTLEIELLSFRNIWTSLGEPSVNTYEHIKTATSELLPDKDKKLKESENHFQGDHKRHRQNESSFLDLSSLFLW